MLVENYSRKIMCQCIAYILLFITTNDNKLVYLQAQTT